MDKIVEQLNAPEQQYFPTYFWSWNDRLEEKELRRQIKEMKSQGIGGFFIHARPGLETPYMSEEWLKAIRAVLDECKKQGLSPWLYDEYGWPSGFNGGSVPGRGPDYQQKCLHVCKVSADEISTLEHLLGVYKIADGKCIRLSQPEQMCGSMIAVFYTFTKDYVDILSEKAIAAFLQDSYERYAREFPSEFSTLIPGIFTDEPQYNAKEFPWSFELPEAYHSKYGKDILDELPGLLYDFEGAEEFRYRFYSTVNGMFVKNYFQQIGQWCQEHNMVFTGHNMAEDGLFDSLLFNAGVMPTYQYMQMPGTDWVSRTIRETTTPKQCSSVAHQLGKPRALTEQFASCNWDVPLEELKWIVDWNYVNGINFFCQHLAAYSLRGLRKRDCPASLFDHNVWWEKYHLLTGYMSRLSKLLSGNEEVCGLAVLHPIKSAYLSFKRANEGELLRLDNEFLSVLDYLSGMHIAYHIADEDVMRNHGSVQGNALIIGQCRYNALVLPRIHTLERSTYNFLLEFAKNGGLILSFGELPNRIDGQIDDLSELYPYIKDCSTLLSYQRILHAVQQKNQDGYVTSASIQSAKNLPASLDNGEFVARYRNFWEKTAQGILPRTSLDMPEAEFSILDPGTRELLNCLDLQCVSRASVAQNGEQINTIHVYHKLFHGREVWFFANHSKYHGYNAVITLDSFKDFVGYDPLQNTTFPLDLSRAGEKSAFPFHFEPMQSLVIIESEQPIAAPSPSTKKEQVIRLDDDFTVTSYGYNAFTMDYCRYKTSEMQEWSQPTPVWNVHYLLLREKQETDLEIEFSFFAAETFVPGNTLELGLEEVDSCQAVLLNGRDIKSRFSSSRVDRAIRTADIRDLVFTGENTILIRKKYKYDPLAYYTLFGENVHAVMMNRLCLHDETDCAYLFGDFAAYSRSSFTDVERDGAVTAGPFYIDVENRSLCGLDLIKQGYLFYNQAITVEQTKTVRMEQDTRYLIELKKMCAPCVAVSVNGMFVKDILFHPYRADITEFLRDGDNRISLTIYTSNRNLFGNFHYKLGQVHWSNWASLIKPTQWLFCEEEESWFTSRYCFYRNSLEY